MQLPTPGHLISLQETVHERVLAVESKINWVCSPPLISCVTLDNLLLFEFPHLRLLNRSAEVLFLCPSSLPATLFLMFGGGGLPARTSCPDFLHPVNVKTSTVNKLRLVIGWHYYLIYFHLLFYVAIQGPLFFFMC